MVVGVREFVEVNYLSLNLRALQTFLSEWYYTNFKNKSQRLITTAKFGFLRELQYFLPITMLKIAMQNFFFLPPNPT